MKYVKDGIYPYTFEQAKSDHPDISFSRETIPGAETVHPGEIPQHDWLREKVVEEYPIETENGWVEHWVNVPTSEEEQEMILAQAKSEVDAIRDRMTDAGVIFEGAPYQTRAQDRENIAGAIQLAILSGGEFSIPFIGADNVTRTLNTEQLVGLGTAIAMRKAELIFRGRDVKDALLNIHGEYPDIEAMMGEENDMAP